MRLPGPVWFLQISPDNSAVAATTQDYGVFLVPLTWPQEHAMATPVDEPILIPESYGTCSLAFSPDSTLLATANCWDTILLTTLGAPGRPKAIHTTQHPTAVVFSEESRTLAVGTTYRIEEGDYSSLEGSLILFDVGQQSELREIPADRFSDGICSLAVSPDGSILAAGYCSYYMRTWDILSNYAPLQQIYGLDRYQCFSHCPFPINNVAISPDNATIASGTNDPQIAVRDVLSGKLRFVISTGRILDDGSRAFPSPVNSLAFNHDGSALVIAADNELQLRDTSAGDFLWHTENPVGEPFTSLAMSADGRLLISATEEGTITFWGVPTD